VWIDVGTFATADAFAADVHVYSTRSVGGEQRRVLIKVDLRD
jgi:hypothetical protein